LLSTESRLHHFDLLSVTDETTVAYAAQRVALKRSRHPIPVSDAWIAALAVEQRLPLLSGDVHFGAVPDLERGAGKCRSRNVRSLHPELQRC
jgi:predicted nucleic acid-binding protein